MHTKYHALIGIILAIMAYAITKDIPASLVAFLLSWAPDADHVIDYMIHERTFKLNPHKLLTGQHYLEHETMYIPLHAYELTPLIYLTAQAILGAMAAITAVIAYLLHLVTDTITNPIYPRTLLMTWRIVKRFRLEHLCRDRKPTS